MYVVVAMSVGSSDGSGSGNGSGTGSGWRWWVVLTVAAAVAFDSGWRWRAVLTVVAALGFDSGSVASSYLWRQKRVKVLAQRFSAGVRIVPELE
jgi:hypothetical protein